MTHARGQWGGRLVRWACSALALLAMAAAPVAARGPAQGAPAPAALPAEMIYALTGSGTLVRFSSAAPGVFNLTVPISGLPAGVSLAAIDFRPSTGQLYALGLHTASMSGLLFVINPNTGATSIITTTAFYSPLNPTLDYDIDFNPGVDRLRMINSEGLNLRVNPFNGTLSGHDLDLHSSISATQRYASLAYAPGKPGLTASTAYVYEYLHDNLFMLGGPDGSPSANGGLLTKVGAAGVSSSAEAVGLDISSGGVAYASMQTGGGSGPYGLYQVNLSTGHVALVGNILDGQTPIKDIAVVPRFSNFIPIALR